MKNDQPIRFRTFADEDDVTWDRHDQRGTTRTTANAAFEPDERRLGAMLPPAEPRPARSGAFLAWGTGLALVAGVAIAVTLLPKPGAFVTDGRAPAPSLEVHRYVAPQLSGLASSARLPCYVGGVPAGSLTLTDCGQRNGVAGGRLDVGLNASPQASATSSPPASTVAAPTSALAPSVAEDDARPALARPQPPPIPRAIRPAPAALDVFTDVRAAQSGPTTYAHADRPRWEPYDPRPSRAYDDDADRSGGRALNPEDSVEVAQTFYEGLADGDGARAASVVVPEKRRQGPLSAGAISRFYSNLRAPLRLTRLYPVDDHTVVARYAFVDRNGEVCQGTARVTTIERNGEVYVQGVRALDGC